MVNKSANDSEKPNMATIGVKRSVSIETKRVPMSGPVQENETTVKVAAMKKIPVKPLESDLESSLLTKELGNIISNAPRKEIPNITRIKK